MIAYERTGRNGAPPVMLLHSLALDRSVWTALAERLAPAHDLIAVDLPGHGASPPVSAITIEEMADAAAEILRAESVGRACVIGMSMGGCVAQALAIRHGGMVTGLGVLDSTAWYGAGAAETWETRAQRAVEEGFKGMADFQLSRWFTPRFLESDPDTVSRLFDVFVANDRNSYVAACRAMGSVDLRAALGSIRCPTVVAVGDNDYATPVEHSRLIADSIPGASLHVLEGCAHLSAVECPGKVEDALQAVLSGGRNP